MCTRLSGSALMCALVVLAAATSCGPARSTAGDAGDIDPPITTPSVDSGTPEPDAGTGLLPGMMCAVLPTRVICPAAQAFWSDAGTNGSLLGLATNSGGGSTTTISVSIEAPARGLFSVPVTGSITYSLTRCDAGSCYTVCQLAAGSDAGYVAAGTAYRSSPSFDFFLRSDQPADGGECAGTFEVRANFSRP